MDFPILATGLGGLVSGVNLIFTIIFTGIIVGGGLFVLAKLGSNAMGWGGENAVKQRKQEIITSLTYMAISLVFTSVLFGGIKLLGLDQVADSGNSKATNFLEQKIDDIESGNYNSTISSSDNSDYSSDSNDDPLNFGN